MGMSNPGHNRRAAWRAALACMVTLSVAMGLGRFAFTPMLPLMLHEGRLDLQGGGLLASLNYLGYFLGAVSCASLRVRAATPTNRQSTTVSWASRLAMAPDR